jgi:hypothetical protein
VRRPGRPRRRRGGGGRRGRPDAWRIREASGCRGVVVDGGDRLLTGAGGGGADLSLHARRRRTRVRTNGWPPRVSFCHVGLASLPWRDRIGGGTVVRTPSGGLGAPSSGRTRFATIGRIKHFLAYTPRIWSSCVLVGLETMSCFTHKMLHILDLQEYTSMLDSRRYDRESRPRKPSTQDLGHNPNQITDPVKYRFMCMHTLSRSYGKHIFKFIK